MLGIVYGSRTTQSVLHSVNWYPFFLILCVDKSQFRDYSHLPYLPSIAPWSMPKGRGDQQFRNMSGRAISWGPVDFSLWLLKLFFKNANDLHKTFKFTFISLERLPCEYHNFSKTILKNMVKTSNLSKEGSWHVWYSHSTCADIINRNRYLC